MRDRDAFGNCAALRREFFSPSVELSNEICDVSARLRSFDPVFSPEMDLKSIELEPKTATALQRLGLWYFRHAKDAAIEFARLVLGRDRYTDLDVMCCLYHLLSKFGPHLGFN